MSVEEWDSLPWWQSQLYREGLGEGFASPEVAQEQHMQYDDELDELSAKGFTIQRVG